MREGSEGERREERARRVCGVSVSEVGLCVARERGKRERVCGVFVCLSKG